VVLVATARVALEDDQESLLALDEVLALEREALADLDVNERCDLRDLRKF
jgi:hypothetical protein